MKLNLRYHLQTIKLSNESTSSMDDSCYFKTVNKSRRIRKNSGEEFATNSTKPHLRLTNIAPENRPKRPKREAGSSSNHPFSGARNVSFREGKSPEGPAFWTVGRGCWMVHPSSRTHQREPANCYEPWYAWKISMICWRFWEKKPPKASYIISRPKVGKLWFAKFCKSPGQ